MKYLLSLAAFVSIWVLMRRIERAEDEIRRIKAVVPRACEDIVLH